MLVQSHRRIEARLTAKRVGRGRVGSFFFDDLRNDFPGDWLDVSAIGHFWIGHDGGGIRIDQHHRIAFFAERLTRLRAAIVEFATLSNDDGSGADEKNLARRSVRFGMIARHEDLRRMDELEGRTLGALKLIPYPIESAAISPCAIQDLAGRYSAAAACLRPSLFGSRLRLRGERRAQPGVAFVVRRFWLRPARVFSRIFLPISSTSFRFSRIDHCLAFFRGLGPTEFPRS